LQNLERKVGRRWTIQGLVEHYKNDFGAGCWWLMHIILATREAEIRRIKVQGQPQLIVGGTPTPK
jgi:hypothetical protein